MFSHSGHVMTLANSIIGVGILAMPFCFQKCGIILSIVLLVLSNWITRVCCHYLIKTSLLTRRKSFEMLGLHAFGTSGKLLAELCIIGYLIGTCITYFVVVGDLGPQIVAKLFSLDMAEYNHLRTVVMFAVTVCCIVPLGMLRNVDSLSAVCTASIGFYVCLMLKIVLESEAHIVANDWTEKVTYWEPAGVLQCLPIFSMALSCQMQLFEVFDSINNQSLDKLNGIVRNATWICTLVYIAVGFFGYVAFCTHSFSGNILVNLSPSFGSDIIKIGFVLSIAFSFPLVIFPCRASIYSLLYRKQGHTESSSYIPEQRFRLITLFIVIFSLCVALMIPSVELIIGLVGSTIGVAICIMFPASSFRKIIRKESTERTLAQFVFVSGFCLMILGTYANLNAIDAQSSGPQFDGAQVVTPLLPNDISPPAVGHDLKSSEIIKLLVKNSEAEAKGVLEKLENGKREPNANGINLVEKSNIVGASSDNQPMPPLPVDESHSVDANNEAPPIKSESIPKVEPKPVEGNERVSIVKKNLTILEKSPAANMPVPKPETSQSLDLAAQRTIDGAAIKKEEEITAEEQKDKANADELRKTEKELQEKMKALERTVDKLNEELAKQKPQSPDTMKLLESSVDKLNDQLAHQNVENPKPLAVNELDKALNKVKENNLKKEMEESQPQPQLQAQSQPQDANNTRKERKPASLMEMLTENAHAREEQEAHAGVFEPLSYKTGELLKNSTGGAPLLAQRLPLPLVLLSNSTRTRTNGTLAAEPPANRTTNADNVDAIRRELLQVNEPKIATAQPAVRVKRDANENCLPEPKLNELKNSALVGLSLQIENMGRELKSVKDDDLETTTTMTTTSNTELDAS
ncbi:putative sodium-coupled neutral amino acid transporter 10 [Drosophila novamexicana]|uniref:putative sodium-coupled neutral amino acid transporter 10 n=1 Tax=Drosophila novamexicana TaxID=47314 RepID=UPI0011E59312|nr:putative sodium-coupled neutral amino acid transporter 10 [Drosophila novamexicana]XP_030557902.1 putative sodium-coupled neutral amino acid transporter 10 [Drosophila novamexicana]